MIDLDRIPDNNMEALPCDKVSQVFRHLYVHFDYITNSVSKVVAAVTLFLESKVRRSHKFLATMVTKAQIPCNCC